LGILSEVMRVPVGLMKIAKETLRHLLRRPVVGIVAVARTEEGSILLIRRGDTGKWALPGGTVEWGETLRDSLPRELWEEAGVKMLGEAQLVGVYSDPDRDPRFHAVTVVVTTQVTEPKSPPVNSVEIVEVRLFSRDELPIELSHQNLDMLENALSGQVVWE
jgi:8-oxo-dGTP diphosphatase